MEELKAIRDTVLPVDTMGRIDRGKLVELLLRARVAETLPGKIAVAARKFRRRIGKARFGLPCARISHVS